MFLWPVLIPSRTGSDDGSSLYLGSLGQTTSAYNFAATPLVNNDGLHGTVNVNSASVVLQAGVYPIAVAYFQQGGGVALTASLEHAADGCGQLCCDTTVCAFRYGYGYGVGAGGCL